MVLRESDETFADRVIQNLLVKDFVPISGNATGGTNPTIPINPEGKAPELFQRVVRS